MSLGTATLTRFEADNPKAGGVRLVTPSGIAIDAGWMWGTPIVDTLGAAKALSTRFVDTLLREHGGKDVDRINWTSVTAAIQRHVMDWNENLRKHLYGAVGQDAPTSNDLQGPVVKRIH